MSAKLLMLPSLMSTLACKLALVCVADQKLPLYQLVGTPVTPTPEPVPLLASQIAVRSLYMLLSAVPLTDVPLALLFIATLPCPAVGNATLSALPSLVYKVAYR